MYPPTAFGDAASSNSVLSGIMAALYYRTVSGEGTRVTTSLYANGIWCNFARIIECQERKDNRIAPVFPRTAEEANWPFSNIYQCKDGLWILIATYYKSHFGACMKALGLEEYMDDPRFNTEENMREHKGELRDLYAEAFKTKPIAEWIPILLKYDIVHQQLMNSKDVTKDEQAWANDYLANVKFPSGEEYVLPNSPVTFFGLERSQAQHAGGIGCDTTEILTRCGYSGEEIHELKAKGIAYGN